MREILFRGKRTDNGEWIEGAFCPKDCDSPFAPMVDRPSIIKLDDPCSGYWFEVDAESVGQYTGLTDKNGKKIFEGDIVVYDNTPYSAYGRRLTCEIIFRRCQWQGKYAEFEGGYYYALSADDFFGTKSEVIGNVYDNPELLGGADNEM